MGIQEELLQRIEDEQFCVAFELRTLSGIITQGQLERWLPGFSYQHTEVEHSSRYSWVCQFVNKKNVLDIACGAGGGSYLIACEGNANRIVACDINQDVIKYASIRHSHHRITYRAENAETFKDNQLFDIIVSFETIEHIPNVEMFLQHIRASLNDKGHFFVSTPISGKNFDNNPCNAYHLREWGFESFHDMISKFFKIENIYLQLYPPTQPKLRRLIRRFWNKADNPDFDICQPIKWDSEKIPATKLGKDLAGYQILQCKK